MSERFELTAYCGLYCPDCIRYKSKAAELAKSLLNELNNTEFETYARIKSTAVEQVNRVKELEHYKECRNVLETIVKLQCNNACRVGPGCPTFSCNIIECCKNKGFAGCWQCNKNENCTLLKPLETVHGVCIKENLNRIKELGLEKWAKNKRCKSYIWQQ
jgi:hypothetical protein